MQEKYSGESLQPISVVLESDNEAKALTLALRRFKDAVELEAITRTEEVREQIPELMDKIDDMTSRIDGGEWEIPVGRELTIAGKALHKLVGDFEAAATDTRTYDEMLAGQDSLEFYLCVCTAHDMLFASEHITTILE